MKTVKTNKKVFKSSMVSVAFFVSIAGASFVATPAVANSNGDGPKQGCYWHFPALCKLF